MDEKTNYLIFCSFEVGGVPYQIAEVLNRHGLSTCFISLTRTASGHDSVQYHFGKREEKWILSPSFPCRASAGLIIKQLKRLNKQYNFSGCFATGIKAWLLARAGIPYYYWSYGSDLDQACFIPAWMQNSPFWKKILKLPRFLADRKAARKSIGNAEQVLISPYQWANLQAIGPAKGLFFLPHILQTPDFNELQALKEKSHQAVTAVTNFNRYFFSPSRHTWSGYLKNQTDNKGNDIILKAFRRYLELAKDESTTLVLIEKGPDVAASKELIKELKIEKYIIWLKEMPRKELELYYQGAYLCFGQFTTPVLTFATLEPLANGTPCISFFGSQPAAVPYYQELPPIFNSKEVEAIARYIQRLSSDQDLYGRLCYDSWAWVKQNCNEENFVKAFAEIIR